MALSHLLQPKSSLQIFRLGFLAARRRCCFPQPELKEEAGVEETGIMAVGPFQKESIKNNPTFISHKEAPYTRLADLFSQHKVDRTETTEDHEGTQQPNEALSDVLLDCYAKHKDSGSECLSHPNYPLPSEPVLDSQDSHFDEFPPANCENDQSILSDRNDNATNLKDLYAENSDNYQAVTEIEEPLEHSGEPLHNKQGTVNRPVIKGLISLLREQQCASSNSTSSNNKKGRPVKENMLNGNLLVPDSNNNSLTSQDFHNGTCENEDEEMDAKANSFVSVPLRDKDERQLKKTSFSREENGVLVRFLRSSTLESHILEHFNKCGEILNVEFRSSGGSLLKSAYILFKTKEGVTKALKKSGSCINRWVLTVESASSAGNVRIPMPNLTGDHDIPAALVKNPTRTIKIEHLSREISSCHIKEALAFCDCNVSGYFMGSSHSVAYVEFETEIGKEKVLAKQSISVLGKRLTMLRIDPPRTTVVRISNVQALGMSKVLSVCRSLGVVRQSIQRNYYVLDVHFDLAEWPNMLKILNRLNGFEIEGTQFQAEPAPVFPPDVLIALWDQPEEKKLLKATVHGLLRKLGDNTCDTSELASLQHIFLDKI